MLLLEPFLHEGEGVASLLREHVVDGFPFAAIREQPTLPQSLELLGDRRNGDAEDVG